MGNPKAFMTIMRKEAGYRPVDERVYDFSEVEQTLNIEDRKLQASRCMDCGIPFCHWACPLNNKMPEWQDLAYKGKWFDAYKILSTTNDFPEFTGRICPAPCEKSCVLKLHEEPVTIRENEAAVAEQAFLQGFIKPVMPSVRTGKKVAVIGSGPAGLACANRLNHKGHSVTVFEKDEAIGGLLRFGIPDFKLHKQVIDRRLDLMQAEGVAFRTSVNVGIDISAKDLLKEYDAVCIAIGSGVPRNLNVPGRELKGVYFALEFLQMQNRIIAGETIAESAMISAKGKNVLVIGGGDTGSDCVGTSIRQKASSVTQIEILPKPPANKNPDTPWPLYPMVLKTSSSHEEGCVRRWNLDTVKFIGEDGKVTGAEIEEVEWAKDAEGRMTMTRTGKKEVIKAELVLLSMGFVNPVYEGLLQELGVELTQRKNVAIDNAYHTSVDKVFAVGDAAMGASLVVRAIASGRDAAIDIDRFLRK
ncbi:glutamate synthase subunit beta [Microbacter margulisiae]|uniref:Glutamate synthase (NADPH/NADH) small chain n=1 Tax=Microbacter margulisiae TaxID=1350067 RepID=A0A7W5DS21_9PORP|nr:glutamate synthase subunit beta [Microbacter margulisiae]MBB3188022.1 glutamate synthase (NADPH/NADH) small chain [Microbacter margulisiae]